LNLIFFSYKIRFFIAESLNNLFLRCRIFKDEGFGLDKRQLVVAQSCDPHVSNLSDSEYLKKRDLLFTQQIPLFFKRNHNSLTN